MNKIQVIGNIVRDAIIRDSNGKKAINFVVAVNENYKNKEGIKVEKATFYSCTLWRDALHSTEVTKFLTKGTKVFVEGNPSAELYKTKENETAIDHRIKVSNLILLSFADKKEGDTKTETQDQVSSTVSADEDLSF